MLKENLSFIGVCALVFAALLGLAYLFERTVCHDLQRRSRSRNISYVAMFSALGGVLGIGLGYLLSALANRILPLVMSDMEMTVSPSLGSVAVAFGISVGIGVLFGYLPAKRAARLNPIEALRYD